VKRLAFLLLKSIAAIGDKHGVPILNATLTPVRKIAYAPVVDFDRRCVITGGDAT
jgi:hypothetical protein